MARLAGRVAGVAGVAATLAALAAGVLPAAAHAHGEVAAPPVDEARLIRFPDVGDRRTLVVDLHTHSAFSDGHVWPKIRVEEALRDGVDGLAITEHLEYQPHCADVPHPDRNRAFAEAVAAAAGSDLIVIAGAEITRDMPNGHVNAVFIRDANALLRGDPSVPPADVMQYYAKAGEWPAREALQAVQAQGGFTFWNHPYWTRQQPDGIARISDFHRENIARGLLHGIEVANGADYSAEAFAIGLQHDLTLLGVSDVHDLVDWDYPPAQGEHRPVTLVFAPDRSADAIHAALREKRTVVWYRNLLLGRADQLQPLLAASLVASDAQYVEGSDTVRVRLDNRSDARLQLQNRSGFTPMDSAELIEVPAHGSVQVTFKPGAGLQRLRLKFDVLNARVAPEQVAQVELDVPVAPVQPSAEG